MNEPAAQPQTNAAPARTPRFAEFAGWYGTAAILLAYALSSFQVIEPGRVYHFLNLTGALGVALICWHRRTWQPFWLEVVWALVAAAALVRLVVG